jgi:hypothetical protein
MMSSPVVVRKSVPVRLMMDEAAVVLSAEFVYTTADPYAVEVTFNTGLDGAVVWTFSRELLKSGLTQLSGDGDVKIGPAGLIQDKSSMFSLTGAGKLISMTLTSPYGVANFVMNEKLVNAFVDDIYTLVPVGEELEYLHMDEGLAAILGESDTL